jgi:hypothetical protein
MLRFARAAIVGSVTALAISACAESLETSPHATVQTTGAETTNLASYRTYEHAADVATVTGWTGAPISTDTVETVWREVDAALEAKGYRAAPGGDLIVRLSTGQRRVERQPTGRVAAAGAPPSTVTEGSLGIEIVERSSQRVLFHGAATDEIHGPPSDARLKKAVGDILERVPVAR